MHEVDATLVPRALDSGARVLLVDDEPDLVRAYARTLRHIGCAVHTACDGLEAAAMIGAVDLDVVISDITMPRMDGVALLKAVREKDLDLPVILMTAHPSVESAARAVELGALRYLIKPLDLESLPTIVAGAVRMYRLAKLKREALEHLNDARPWIGDRAGLTVRFENALRTLWMAYQPIVKWSSRDVFAFEALVRPIEPSLPDPESLLAAAERLGRLNELGRTLRTQIAANVADGPADSLVFVNLHAHELMDESLFDTHAPLSRLADRVFLEVTERASLEGIKDLRARVKALRRMGFRIVVDDLGAGYAGLTTFAQLEPDVVKLDGWLVRNVHCEPVKQRLVRSLIALCDEMGALVVCEGVESEDERRAVVDMGCDLLQGFLFAHPGPPFPRAELPDGVNASVV